MNVELNRVDRSRLHLAALRAMRVTDEPENAAKNAYSELISRTGLLEDDPETWVLMR